MRNKFLTTIILMSVFICSAKANAEDIATNNMLPINSKRMEIDIQSKRIPAGTKLRIRVETEINTDKASEGNNFDSTIVHDIKVGNDIILPTGTVLRGTIGEINKASRLSKSAHVLLSFDHLVTPVGKQVPVYAVITNYNNLTYLGAITSGSSYKSRVKEGYVEGKDICYESTQWGIDTGKSFWNGYPVLLTVPITATVGLIGGTSYFTGKSILSLFQKGDDVIISKGKIFDIRLTQPLDIPVN